MSTMLPDMDLEAMFGLRPFTKAQALELGVTDKQWRLVKSHLTFLERGVYVVRRADDDRTRHCQKVAGALLRKTDHFAIGRSAVALLELPKPLFQSWDTVAPEIGARQTRTKRGIRRSTAVPVSTAWGPCTDLVDTAIHIAGTLELPQALMVTDAVARRLADTDNRHVLASEQCRTEVRRRLTKTVDLPALRLANPAAESPAESYYRGNMILQGHHDPPCGVPYRGASGKEYFIDILLDGLAIEIDGETKYTALAILVAEKKREDDLRLAGLHMLRAWVKDIYADPAAMMNELADKLDEVRWLRRRSG